MSNSLDSDQDHCSVCKGFICNDSGDVIWRGKSWIYGWKFSLIVSGAVKGYFQPYIRQYTSPNEYFEYGYPHSNALTLLFTIWEHCKPTKAAFHSTKCDAVNVKLFLTVYHGIYCLKFLMLSNQMSRYISKSIRT